MFRSSLSGCVSCLLVVATIAGCNVYDASLIGESSAEVPPRPPGDTSSPDDAETLVFALQNIFIEQSAEQAAKIGLNLDATETTGPDNATCEPRTVEGEVVGQPVVDGEKGIDNSVGAALLPTVSNLLPCLQDNLALTQGRGVGTIILWVRGWNGDRHDANVSVVLTTAIDGTSANPELVGFGRNSDVDLVYLKGNQDEEALDPAWAANDWWYLDPADFDDDETGSPSPDLPKVEQTQAYITFGRLVVPLLPGTTFKLIAGDGSIPSDGAMNVVVNGGFMMGDLSEDRTRLEQGTFTGRFSIEKLGEATPQIGMCDINASVVETLFGQYADIQSLPEMDGTGAECDALSLGITFGGMGGGIAGLASTSRPSLTPCDNIAEFTIDRCCPTEWLAGKARADVCDTPEKLTKAARFDALPSTVAVPLSPPDLL